MPVERQPISVSQLSELLGVDPAQFVAVERRLRQWYVVTEGETDMQTTGTFPQLADNTRRKPSKKGGKR